MPLLHAGVTADRIANAARAALREHDDGMAAYAKIYKDWSTPEGERGRRVLASTAHLALKKTLQRLRRVDKYAAINVMAQARNCIKITPDTHADMVVFAEVIYILFGQTDSDWQAALAYARQCQINDQQRAWQACLEHCASCEFDEFECLWRACVELCGEGDDM